MSRYAVTLVAVGPWLASIAVGYLARGVSQGESSPWVGRTVLITGISRGLGRALAIELLGRGSRVIGLARDPRALELLRGESAVRASEARLTVFQADVSDKDAVAAGLVAAGINPATIDVAIVNAGVKLSSAAVFDAPAMRRTLEINLIGAVNTIAAVLPGMIAKGRGHIVFITSLGRWHGMTSAQGYNASKAALANVADSLRMDLRCSGYRDVIVTAIEPGLLRTDMAVTATTGRLLSIDIDVAVRHVLSAIERRKRTARFPLRMVLPTFVVAMLPSPLRDALLARAKPPTAAAT